LKAMSRDQKHAGWFGWCMYDWANSGFATVVLSAVFPVYFLVLVPQEGAHLTIGSWAHLIPGPALWGYLVSFSLLLVALSAPYFGALADRRQMRHSFLLTFCLIGAVATCMLALARSGNLILAAFLFAVANFCFAAGNIFYNAFLPDLGGEKGMNALSARGFAFGYIGGGLCLLIVFALIQGHAFFGFSGPGVATRFGLLLTGCWWALFAIPTFRALAGKFHLTPAQITSTPKRSYLETLRSILDYPDLRLFLLAFLFYNDGIQTVIMMAAVFAKDELQLSQASILGCFLMIQFVAMPGSLLFGRLADKIGTKRSIIISLICFIGVVVWAWFITHNWQFWVLGFVVALILGGSQAISRSLYAALIPKGRNAEFFGFYAISAKFAAIFGPLVFALITDITGSCRNSIVAMALFFIIGMLLLTKVDVNRGMHLARNKNT